ncbi:hypothetical protein C0993_005726 [Termitomyces sp. T159_Od127]|nr:hypothetical protein C0993_005726 [Termitomyces sp. T159_Od127]
MLKKAFNEPDFDQESNIQPSEAASLWKKYLEPMKANGIRLGAPAVTSNGQPWLAQFMHACSGCSVDFIPLHWYGDGVEGFYNYIWQVHGTYPNTSLWVTEFASTSSNADEVANFLNASIAYMDTLPWIERYAWFGYFRPRDTGIYNLLGADGSLNTLGQIYVGAKTVHTQIVSQAPTKTFTSVNVPPEDILSLGQKDAKPWALALPFWHPSLERFGPSYNPDEVAHQKKADHIVDTVLRLLDLDHDGRVSPEELEKVGLDGLPNFDDLGAEGHHYDVESEFFLHHEEQYHSTPETQTDESYNHPEDMEHFAAHERIEREEAEREAKFQGISVEEVLQDHQHVDSPPPIAASENNNSGTDPSHPHGEQIEVVPPVQEPPIPKVTRVPPPEKQDPNVRFKDAPAEAKRKGDWGEGGYRAPTEPSDRLRRNLPYKVCRSGFIAAEG